MTDSVLASYPVAGLGPGVAYGFGHVWAVRERRVVSVAVGENPNGVAFDGTYVWVALSDDDNVMKIDPETDTVVATVAVGAAPTGLCFDGTYLWVSNYNDGTLSKIDPETDTVVATVTVDTFPQRMAISDGYLWVTQSILDLPRVRGRVTKVDLDTDTAVASVEVGDRPTGICFDGAHVWSSSWDDGTLSKIDPESDTVVATVTVGSVPVGVVSDGTYLWVANSGSPNVMKIDLGTDTVVATVTDSDFGAPWQLLIVDERVWVSDLWGSVWAIDLGTDTVVDTMPVGGSLGPLAYDGQRLWCSDLTPGSVGHVKAIDLSEAPPGLLKIDSADGTVVDSVECPTGAYDVCCTDQWVWVSNGSSLGVVYRIDPTAVTVEAALLLDPFEFPYAQQPVALHGDTTTGLVYVGDDNGNCWVADPDVDTFVAGFISPSGAPITSVVPHAGAVWAAQPDENVVYRLDPDLMVDFWDDPVVDSIATDDQPHHLVAWGDLVYVTHADANRLSTIDPDTNDVAVIHENAGTPGLLRRAVVFDGTLHVTRSDGPDVLKFSADGTLLETVAVTTDGEPWGVAAGPSSVWVACRG